MNTERGPRSHILLIGRLEDQELMNVLSSVEHIGDLDQRFLWRGSGDSMVGALQRKVEDLETGSLDHPLKKGCKEQRHGKLVGDMRSRVDFLDEKYCSMFSS